MAGAGAIRAGSAYVELSVKDKITRGLDDASRKLKAFGYGVAAVGGAVSAAGTALIAPFIASAKTFSATGDQLAKMAKRTGVSAGALAELSYAAELSDVSIEDLGTAFKFMQRSIAEASAGEKTAIDRLALLGLKVEELRALSPEEQFQRMADELAKISDPADRARAAIELFGRSGTNILPLIGDIRSLRAEAAAIGVVMTGDMAGAAEELNDSFSRIAFAVRYAAVAVGGALAPTLTKTANIIARVIGSASAWARENGSLIRTVALVAAGVAAAGAAIAGLGLSIVSLGFVLGALSTIATAVGAALGLMGAAISALLSPAGALLAVGAALAVGFALTSKAVANAAKLVRSAFGSMISDAKEAAGAIGEALASGNIVGAAKVLWATMRLEWARGVAALTPLLSGLGIEAGMVWDEMAGSAQVAWAWVSSAALQSLEILRTGLLKMGAFVGEVFWKAVQGVADSFAWLATKIMTAGYELHLIDDEEVADMDRMIKGLKGGASAFIAAQGGLSSDFYDRQLKESLDRQKGMEAEYQKAKEAAEAGVDKKREERYKAAADKGAAATAEVAKAEERLKAAMESAKEKPKEPDKAPDKAPALDENLRLATEGALAASAAAGSFGGLSLPTVLAGDASGRETAANTAGMLQEQKKTNDLLKDSAVNFG